MIQTLGSKNVKNDRVKLPFTYDVEKMLQETRSLKEGRFEYYDVIPLTGPAHIIDPSLPVPPPTEDYADGSWTDWLDTTELKNSPYLMEIVDQFREHTTVTLVRLLRLAPGSIVREHTDPTLALEVPKSVIRLTIPILNNDKVKYFLNGTHVDMRPGELWYLKLSDPHKIDNLGDEERINFTIDMIPNEWVRSLIKESQV